MKIYKTIIYNIIITLNKLNENEGTCTKSKIDCL